MCCYERKEDSLIGKAPVLITGNIGSSPMILFSSFSEVVGKNIQNGKGGNQMTERHRDNRTSFNEERSDYYVRKIQTKGI